MFFQPGDSPSTRDGLIDTSTKIGFPRNKRAEFLSLCLSPPPATEAWDTDIFSGFDVLPKRKCPIQPLHIWGAAEGTAAPVFCLTRD